ncbi:hypothetical protein JCM8208_001049 [Rhodotorula glutinis]
MASPASQPAMRPDATPDDEPHRAPISSPAPSTTAPPAPARVRNERTTSAAQAAIAHPADNPAQLADDSPSPSTSARSSRRTPSRRSLGARRNGGAPPPQPGTFLTRFLGTFRPPTASEPARPHLPRSLSSPVPSVVRATDPDVVDPRHLPPPVPSTSTCALPPLNDPAPSTSGDFTKRLRPSFRRHASGGTGQQPSPSASPASSPGLAGSGSDGGGALSPGSPATLRGLERDPMDTVYARNGVGASTPARRNSITSQRTVQAYDHAYPSGAPSTPLAPIDEPELPSAPPRLEQSFELIATLLPPALLLLSQLGPTHLFSPPVQLPALFEATLDASQSRKSSISSATGSNALLSSGASIASTATSSTTSAAASFFSGLHMADSLIPTHSHELHAPSTLSIPAVSAGAIWRLFRGFEWIGEVGRGAQPLPHAPVPSVEPGRRDGPPLEPEDDPEQVFDFPALLQGVADVLAADAAARGIELVVGQAGSGSAPSPVTTPDVATADKGKDGVGPAGATAAGAPTKDTETRELLVRADERAWSVTLIWIIHHILAGAATGSTVDARFIATAATPPSSPTPSRSSSPEPDARPYPPAFSPSRPQKWWNVSLDILVTAPPLPPSPPFIDENAATPAPVHLPTPPLDTAFARSLFSLVQLRLAPSTHNSVSARSWALEALLPAARPKTQSIADDPSTLLGRRRASLDLTVGQEPSMDDLKRFADTALKGHRVALHAGETSAFAKDLTTYLAGWGMDVQHVPVDNGSLSGGSATSASDAAKSSRASAGAGARFDSGFETATSSPGATASSSSNDPLPSDTGTMGEGHSSLVIIDDDVATLRRLLVSLRTPPSIGPTLMAKRPQLAARRTRSSPHVRQLHQVQQGLSSPQQASQWVIVHFASLTHYKAIKEIVQDTLSMSKSLSIPEVLVVPKPAGPRRIITAIWTALKRPAVDPSLAPIATSPTSPGIQYWTPRLSPALMSEHGFDFGHSELASSKSDSGGANSSQGKPRTPPAFHHTGSNGSNSSAVPPSPLGRIDDTEDSYFSTVSEELKDTTPSEGMVVQSPDGRAGIFFQPQPRGSRGSGDKQRRQNTAERERRATMSREGSDDATEQATSAQREPPPGLVSRMSTATPHEIGLGSYVSGRRVASSGSAASGSAGSATDTSPPGSNAALRPGTPALTLDSFITAAKSRATGADVSPEELPSTTAVSSSPLAEGNSRQLPGTPSVRSSSTRRSMSGSNGTSGSVTATQSSLAATSSLSASPRASSSAQSPLHSPRRNPASASASPVPTRSSTPPDTQGAAASAAAAAKALASVSKSAAPKLRTRASTVGGMPRNRRRSSRKGTLPAVPPISVLIVEDNPINQTILSMFMKKKGISYKVAKDGEQAVQMWKKGNFHLVLMDIQLPVKDGIEATREIRELERQNNIGTFITTPTSDMASPMSSTSSGNPFSAPGSPLLSMPVIIVALTASSLQADRVNALAAGCNDFLTKPVSLVWLESKLVEWGSMAYLSGFSRKATEASDTSSNPSSTRGSTPNRPMSPANKSKANAEFTENVTSRADSISQHLHIERPTSRASSPSGHRPGLDSIAGSPSDSPEASPPTGVDKVVGQPVASAAVARHNNPSFTLTSPTPESTAATKAPIPAMPNVPATPAPAAGGDAKKTLDLVEQRLVDLIQEQEETGSTTERDPSAPHRPGPTPLSPSVVMAPADPPLDDVVAESQRLIQAGRGRANSASFGQAMSDSGHTSTASSPGASTHNSTRAVPKLPAKVPPPSD